MNRRELSELIETGEGYTLEFKESVSSSIGKDICAFANSSGGKIILGVTDKGEIKGYKISNRDRSRVQNIAKNMDPSVEVKIEQIGDLGVIFVPEGKNKPYFAGGHCYIRQGASSVLLKGMK
ncbi:MAG: ATP-binding protein [Candidatus Aenigmarchaeota archaeon]|nr:ATP-binding protein [Candidatus Aenigmarchaeota archaeon]